MWKVKKTICNNSMKEVTEIFSSRITNYRR